jgi:hypothetical protein
MGCNAAVQGDAGFADQILALETATMNDKPLDKVVLIHRGALTAKYLAAGMAKIDAALKVLVASDSRRSLVTRVVAVDVADDLAPFGAPAAVHAPNPRALKAVVDAIARSAAPHYTVLVGAGDMMPFVELRNPAYDAQGDPDRTVPSDLPYACDTAYSTDPDRFKGPTRVVGRLPDEPGARQPTLLTRLIRAAAAAKPAAAADYSRYFGLTAQVWQASTALSLRNIFGDDKGLHSAPTRGPSWSAAQLAPKLHFINCHGADLSPSYYGQSVADPGQYPIAHRSSLLHGKIKSGTVLAAECCYGAQLFNPADAARHHGIALTYLAQGALGVFGSTTIAYGPSEGNGSADLITQYFLLSVLEGASLGRAALQARQQFAGERTHLDPVDLKTLAQFYLLGDPSVQPVAVEAHALNRSAPFKKAFAHTADRGVRGLRREKLDRDGRVLQSILPRLKPVPSQGPGPAVADMLQQMAKASGLSSCGHASFDVLHRPARALAAPPAGRRVHVVSGRLGPEPGTRPAPGQPARVVVLIATEQDGRLLHVRRLHAR